jgi:hypothetical protein
MNIQRVHGNAWSVMEPLLHGRTRRQISDRAKQLKAKAEAAAKAAAKERKRVCDAKFRRKKKLERQNPPPPPSPPPVDRLQKLEEAIQSQQHLLKDVLERTRQLQQQVNRQELQIAGRLQKLEEAIQSQQHQLEDVLEPTRQLQQQIKDLQNRVFL